MLCIAYFIIVSGHNIKFFLQNYPFLTCRGWKTTLAVRAHTKGHSTTYKEQFYCLRQAHLAENLRQATHTQNRVKTT